MARLDPPPTCLGRCQPCNKITYQTRKDARTAAKRFPAADSRPYRCPHAEGWHLGHLHEYVRTGQVDRTVWYRKNAPNG